ncbi:Hypothetical protein KNT65_gp205 [Escherichia phage EcS1]|uniref:Uncharacterized protein n=1 Tax=Escherichia phage EcS1 TaxID=2083276 RepID=A0A2Z5ZCA5_9CAUD|nr:Hypothetical protein KNT65_gp205 [Escherichia phage EcS1]BBC78288.1 Hypothetical protein [Escherichia phage EcS1]
MTGLDFVHMINSPDLKTQLKAKMYSLCESAKCTGGVNQITTNRIRSGSISRKDGIEEIDLSEYELNKTLLNIFNEIDKL